MHLKHRRFAFPRFAALVAALLGLLCLVPTTAYALKVAATMTPDNLRANGFTLQTANREDGSVEFTLIRDLSRARTFPAGSGLQVSRTATLRVFGPSGFGAQCDLAPDVRSRDHTIAYRFTLARACLASSRFTLAEDDDYRDREREHLLGGGTHFEFELALFARPSAGQGPLKP